MDIDSLREVVAAASKPPWRADVNDSVYADHHQPCWVVCDALDNDALDARFIATFDPQMVGALLDVAEHAAALRLSTPEYVDEAQHRLSESLDALDALTERT